MIYRACLIGISLMMCNFAFANSKTTLTFCYEDKQLLPYYTGNTSEQPEQAGATIEHLKATAASLDNVEIVFVRLPWLRCLSKIENNEVDALIGSYHVNRKNLGVFPLTEDGQPDVNRSISKHASCLVHRVDNDIQSKLKSDENPIVVARPHGYANPVYPKNYTIVDAVSQQHAQELVLSGRVDATTTLCEVNGIKIAPLRAPLTIIYPPLYSSTGYLIFSQGFYKKHKNIAEQIWQQIRVNIKSERYYQYLSYPHLH